MDNRKSWKLAAPPQRRAATELEGSCRHPGPRSSTLLDALRAYVRRNQAAIEAAFRKASAKGRRAAL